MRASAKTEPHPDAGRVLEHLFGYPVKELLSSPDPSSSAGGAGSKDGHARYLQEGYH